MDKLTSDELISAYLDGELTSAQRAEAERLLSESAEARQLLDELKLLSAGLRALPRMKLEQDFSERILRRAEREMLSAPAISKQHSAAGDNGDARPAPASLQPACDEEIGWRRRLLRVVAWPALATAAALAIMYFGPGSEKDGPQDVAFHAGRPPAEREADHPDSGGPAVPAKPSISISSVPADSFAKQNTDNIAADKSPASGVAGGPAKDDPPRGGAADDEGANPEGAALPALAVRANMELRKETAGRSMERVEQSDSLERKAASEQDQTAATDVFYFDLSPESAQPETIERLFARADIPLEHSGPQESEGALPGGFGGGLGGGAGGAAQSIEKNREAGSVLSKGTAAAAPGAGPAAPPAPVAADAVPAATPALADVDADMPLQQDAMVESTALGDALSTPAWAEVEVFGTPEEIESLLTQARQDPESFLAVHRASDAALGMQNGTLGGLNAAGDPDADQLADDADRSDGGEVKAAERARRGATKSAPAQAGGASADRQSTPAADASPVAIVQGEGEGQEEPSGASQRQLTADDSAATSYYRIVLPPQTDGVEQQRLQESHTPGESLDQNGVPTNRRELAAKKSENAAAGKSAAVGKPAAAFKTRSGKGDEMNAPSPAAEPADVRLRDGKEEAESLQSDSKRSKHGPQKKQFIGDKAGGSVEEKAKAIQPHQADPARIRVRFVFRVAPTEPEPSAAPAEQPSSDDNPATDGVPSPE